MGCWLWLTTSPPPSCSLACTLQALVNIAWSLATLLGPVCASQGSVRQLFNLIHTESVNRLVNPGPLQSKGRHCLSRQLLVQQ